MTFDLATSAEFHTELQYRVYDAVEAGTKVIDLGRGVNMVSSAEDPYVYRCLFGPGGVSDWIGFATCGAPPVAMGLKFGVEVLIQWEKPTPLEQQEAEKTRNHALPALMRWLLNRHQSVLTYGFRPADYECLDKAGFELFVVGTRVRRQRTDKGCVFTDRERTRIFPARVFARRMKVPEGRINAVTLQQAVDMRWGYRVLIRAKV